MKYYADSSFLVSCYIADRNTAAAKTWLSQISVPLPFTALHALEVRNALQLGVFRSLITATDAASALADLRSDLRSGRLVRTTIDWPSAFRMATMISTRHTATVGARSLDILHIAAAKSLRSAEFVSFDARQKSLAGIVGLHTSP